MKAGIVVLTIVACIVIAALQSRSRPRSQSRRRGHMVSSSLESFFRRISATPCYIWRLGARFLAFLSESAARIFNTVGRPRLQTPKQPVRAVPARSGSPGNGGTSERPNLILQSHPPALGQVRPRGLTNVRSSCYMNATLQCLFRLPAFAPKSGPFRAAYSALANQMAGGSAQQPVDMQAFVNAISGGWDRMADPRERNRFNGRSHQVLTLLHDVTCNTPCDYPRSSATPVLLFRVPRRCWAGVLARPIQSSAVPSATMALGEGHVCASRTPVSTRKLRRCRTQWSF